MSDGAAPDGFTTRSFTDAGTTHPVHSAGSGPAVLVLSEVPGITPPVADFARLVAARGCTAVLPEMFGVTGKPASAAYALRTMAQVCVSREFTLLATRTPSPITPWLRALAAEEHERCGGPGVGVVGMCLTGGFALAMMVDDRVVAPVLSQPSLPVGLGRARKADLGLTAADLARVRERAMAGTCVLGLRFTGDRLAPAERFDRLRAELGDAFVAVELDSSPGNPHGHPGNAHSVLTEHRDPTPGSPTDRALEQVLTFLTERLRPAPS